MGKIKTSSLNLQSDEQDDNVNNGCKNKIQKGRMGKQRNIIKISKRRTATLRADGRYQVYCKIDGKRKACYGNTEYKANCEADIQEADQDIKEILLSDKRYVFEYCFYRYRNYLLFYTALEKQTIDRYEATYIKYFPGSGLNQKDVRKITSADISEFLNSILHELKRITTKEYQRIKHIIKAVINFIYDEELDEETEPVLDWEKIKRKIPKGKIYNKVAREYAVSSKDKNILRNKILEENIYPDKFAHVLMLLINFSLGLRIGELAALTVDDVDFDRQVVYVDKSCKRHNERDEYGNKVGKCVYYDGTTKTPKGIREIPISETARQLFQILMKYRKSKGYKSKYLAYDGETLNARAAAMAEILNKLCEKADIQEFHSHIIRKSFASALSKCPDIDIATISEYLGHAQVSTTLNNYIIPANETIDNKIKQMSEYV